MKSIVTDKTKKLLKKKHQGVKIDIGCGARKQDSSWFGIDIRDLPGVDLVHDMEKFPFPIPSNVAHAAVASHVVEHINPHKGVFIEFMNEVWRVMKPGGEFFIATPYAGSDNYWQDPTHCNPCNEMTFEYFDPEGIMSGGGYYTIYHPLPWKIKYSSWYDTGNIELIMIKREIEEKHDVDPAFLKTLKKHDNMTKIK